MVKATLITEHTLGVGAGNERGEYKFVPVGTSLPAERKKDDFTNPGGDVPELPVQIFQGESDDPKKNTLLGTLNITGLEPAARGHHRFEVKFTLNESGLLSTTVKHVNTGKEYPARFDQKTVIGADDVLVTQRDQLLKLFPPAAAAAVGAPSRDRVMIDPPTIRPPVGYASPGTAPLNPYGATPGAPPPNPFAGGPLSPTAPPRPSAAERSHT